MTTLNAPVEKPFSKHLGKRSEMLATSILPFPQNVFYTMTDVFNVLTFTLSSANVFYFDKVKILLPG